MGPSQSDPDAVVSTTTPHARSTAGMNSYSGDPMSSNHSPRVARRGFLTRLTASAAGLTVYAGAPSRVQYALAPFTLGEVDPDAWIDRLRGTDRTLFHAHERLLPALSGARNVLVNGTSAYGLAESDNAVAVASHGPAIGGLFRDEIWDKYALGQLYKIVDPRTGVASHRNPYLESQDAATNDVTVPALMERGVLFLVCNVAVRNLSKRLAQDLEADAIHHELLAGLVPGTIVVPDLFVAMSRAQKKGVSYIYVD
jgi:intracellular sulfur oxidation DsrE/DsrF family protein